MRRSATLLLPVIAAILLPLAPPLAPEAHAQWWRNLGVGVRIVSVVPTDPDVAVESASSWGGSGGMVPEEGWGPAFSFGWFDAELRERGADARTVGTIDVRPVMAGVGYTWLSGPMAITASLTAGVSFNGGSIDQALRAAEVDESVLDVEIGNSFAVQPRVTAKWFLARKLALTGGASFLYSRPDVTVQLPERTVTGRWDANSFSFFGGVTVYPFR